MENNKLSKALPAIPDRRQLRETLENSKLLSEEEIELIVGLRYAEEFLEDTEHAGNPEKALEHRLYVALQGGYDSQFIGQVLTERDQEEYYKYYTDKERIKLSEKERELVEKMSPHVSALARLLEERAETNKPNEAVRAAKKSATKLGGSSLFN